MTLDFARKRFKGEWILFQYTDPKREEGKVLCADRDRDKLVKKLGRRKLPPRCHLTFAGRLLPNPQEYGVILGSASPCLK